VSAQLAFEFGAAPTPSLENFIVGENSAALRCLRLLTDGCTRAHPNASPSNLTQAERSAQSGQSAQIAEVPQCIYLWGPTGVGKSHLTQALQASFASPQIQPARILTAFDDIDRFDETGQHNAFRAWLEAHNDPSKTILATGRWPARDLPLRDDLRSRIAAALVFELRPLSDPARLEALQAASLRRGFQLSDEVARALLHALPRDLGTLNAAIAALDRFSLERKRAVTPALLREWLQQEARASSARMPRNEPS